MTTSNSPFILANRRKDPVIIDLQSLVLHHIGQIAEEYKPRLILHEDEDRMEISWEVFGQVRTTSMPRSEVTYKREGFEQPFLVRLGIDTESEFLRHFLQLRNQSWSYCTKPMIVAKAKPNSDSKIAAWSGWLWSKKTHIMKKDAIPEGELIKTLDYCRSSRCFTAAELSRPIVSLSSGTHSSCMEGDECDGAENSRADTLPSTAAAAMDDPSMQQAQSVSFREVDRTIHHDTAELLQAWQKISDRIQFRLATFAQQETDLTAKKEMLKHQQDEIATKEKSIVERETALKKVVADLQRVASNSMAIYDVLSTHLCAARASD